MAKIWRGGEKDECLLVSVKCGLTFVERKVMKQVMVADAKILLKDLHSKGHANELSGYLFRIPYENLGQAKYEN